MPTFKGSTIRGGLGHSLKKIACALKRQECQDCLLRNTCAYALLYETHPGQGPGDSHPILSPVRRRPHPYVLIPPDDSTRHYQSGEPFSFGIQLFGPAIQYLPHVVFAVQEMGKAGLGRGNLNGEGRFLLEAVYQDDQRIYDGKALAAPPQPISLAINPPPVAPVARLTLTCLTPLRLKYTNQLQGSLPFHLLIRAALRRIAALESAYGEGEPDLDYKGLAARAAQVAIEKAACRWAEIERYSARQKTAMLIGGIMGAITYTGELGEFLPLLRYCEITHLGKQTSFGLGRIRITTEDA